MSGTVKRFFTVIIERDPERLIGEILELPECYIQAPEMPTFKKNPRGSSILP
jgi:hypothetical protein